MEEVKFKVLLYLKRGTKDKSGKSPIMGRITINDPCNGNSMVQFSCKLSCDEKMWNTRESRINGKSKVATEINSKIEKLLLSINEAYDSLQSRKQPFSATDVKNMFQGGIAFQTTLLGMMQKMYEQILARVGVDRSKSATYDYIYARACVSRFIECKFKVKDLAFRQLNEQFIRDFQEYALLEEKYSLSVVKTYLLLLKRASKMAFKEGIMDKELFSHYPLPKCERKPPRALSKEEFEAIRDFEIHPQDERCALVRDMFIFSCYVGAAYIDASSITKKSISTDENGVEWLIYKRGKNQALSRVRLLPEAIVIIRKYASDTRETIFPYINYEKVRNMLLTIKAQLGISGSLGYHVARHTFSTLITLEQGVPMETVSKMLGHSNIATTQIYARVTQSKLFEDMDNFIKNTSDLQLTL